MCDPISLGIAAVTASVVGTGVSAIGGMQAASAARSAQARAQQAQNEAFNARMQAQRVALGEQTAINTQSAKKFSDQQAEQQAAQSGALTERGNLVRQLNEQQAATSAQADQTVQQGVDSANRAALQGAQTSQVAQQTALNTPVVAQVAANNPLGAAGTNSAVTKQAIDEANKGAASYVKNYGDTQARLSGYNAPIALAGNAATTIGTNLMPASVADQLVRTSAPAILAPSTTAYQQAGTYGQAQQEALQREQAGLTGLVNTKAQNATDLANLKQSDDMTVIQNQLVNAQQKAAQLSGLGSGISAIGNAGLMFAGSQGAFANLFGPTEGAPGVVTFKAASPEQITRAFG
jgi:hypothetical protein